MEKQPQLTLVGLEGPVAGRQFTFEGPDIYLGRGQGCHVIVSSSFVSRRHCALRYRQGRWELEDLGARNPARLNGGPSSGPVRPGDVLVLANARFRIEMPTAWSADERPTQVINRDTALMQEYAEVLRELKLSQGRRKGRGARTPHPEAEEPSLPREMSVSITTTPPAGYAISSPGRLSHEAWMDTGEHYPEVGVALTPPGFRLAGPPEPTAQEMAVLAEVAAHPGEMYHGPNDPGEMYPEAMNHGPMHHGAMSPSTMHQATMHQAAMHQAAMHQASMHPGAMHPGASSQGDILSRYVVLRSAAPIGPRLQLPASPPPISSDEEAFERADPIYTEVPEESLSYYSTDDEPTTVYFTAQKPARSRPWPWVVALAGLALATLGVRSCATDSASREASSPAVHELTTSALEPAPAARPRSP